MGRDKVGLRKVDRNGVKYHRFGFSLLSFFLSFFLLFSQIEIEQGRKTQVFGSKSQSCLFFSPFLSLSLSLSAPFPTSPNVLFSATRNGMVCFEETLCCTLTSSAPLSVLFLIKQQPLYIHTYIRRSLSPPCSSQRRRDVLQKIKKKGLT